MTPLARARNAVLNIRLGGLELASNPSPELRAALPAIDEADQIARAVLTAIREPSEGMQVAGYGECHHPKDIPEHIWQAMIDAALSEGG